MLNRFCKYMILIFLLLLVPVSVFAEGDEMTTLDDVNDNTSVLSDSSSLPNQDTDNDVLKNSQLDINTSLDMQDNILNEMELIRNIIGNSIDVDLLECQGYDYNESNTSVLNNEILNIVKDRLTNNNFDYVSLGYDFSADFIDYNDFSYNGTIKVFHNDIYLDQIFATIKYLNTNDYNDIEQSLVSDFINNNNFSFDKEFYLDDYLNQNFDLSERIDSFANQYDIECSSMSPSNTLGDGVYPFACFYNHKFYGKVLANLNKIVKVKVPSNVSNTSDFILDSVKEYFTGVYDDYDFYYSGDFIFVRNIVLGYDFKLGKFVSEVESVPVVNPVQEFISESSSYNEDNNYVIYNPRRYYSRIYSYYVDEKMEDAVGETLGVTVEDAVNISDIIKIDNKHNNIIKKSNDKTTKRNIIKKEKEEIGIENNNKKRGAIKLLFIIVAGISLAGVVIAIINKIIINSEISIDV